MRLKLLTAAFAALVIALPAAHAAPKPAPALQVEPAPHVNIGTPYLAEYRFGKVTLLDTQTVSCSVSLHNCGVAPVTINRVETSCGCTSAVIGDGYDAPMPYKLDPGQSVRLRASILSSHLVPGPVRKTVSIDSSAGEYTLSLLADAVGPAQFADDEVAFGTVKLGQSCTRIVDVLLDKCVADIPVRLISGDNNVVVTPLPGDKILQPKGGDRILRYKLCLAPHPRLGSIYTSLTLLPSQSVTPDGHSYPSVDLPVSGRVSASDVEPTPTQVVFGLVKYGQVETQTVVLKGTGARWTNAAVTSSSPLIKWVPDKPTVKKGVTSGHVVLSSSAPEGDISAQLTVTAKSGESFVIPVFATVSKFAVQ